VEEFLKTLYKICSVSRADGLDLLFDIVPGLLKPTTFDEVDKLLVTIDLSRVTPSTMYALVNLTSDFRFQLPNWERYYQRCREEYARRGESEKHIQDLYDRYETPDPKRLYNPNAIPQKTHEEKHEDVINAKIALAKQLGDKELENCLTYYQSMRQDSRDRERKFHQLRTMGSEELMREKCIKALRAMADKLEESTSCWPGIYYCNLPDDPLLKKTFIDGIEVVISYPWPG
jgi:hypothetical protein